MIAEQQQIMHSYIAKFPEHLQDALAIYHKSSRAQFAPKNILICGLGGSGIGGKIIAVKKLIKNVQLTGLMPTTDYEFEEKTKSSLVVKARSIAIAQS